MTTTRERVVENLNASLHRIMEADAGVFVLGEDILDPYGGAFKVTRGLATRFPSRVFTTPISESGLVGVAGGLALGGSKAIAEVMFGDFVALAFDQLLNFISKSATMYGRRLPMHFVLRCPTGGQRGYGATHSQCLQKHFIGIPNLSLYETTPFGDHHALLERLVNLGSPSILFEDKALYAERMIAPGPIDDLLELRAIGPEKDSYLVSSPHFRKPNVLMICHGGMSTRCMTAIRELFLQHEIECRLLVPSRLYPVDLTGEMTDLIRHSDFVVVAEESVAGGTWGSELSTHIHDIAWKTLKRPVMNLCSRPAAIPSALHLERKVLLQSKDIVAAVVAAVG